MSGINTLLQTLIGSRLPTVMGASFAYTLPLLSIINDYTDKAFTSEHDLPLFHCQYLPPYTAFYWASSVTASGITFIQFANNNSMRNIYVLGVSLFVGLSIPQYFAMNTTYVGHGPVRTNAGWFNNILNTILSSPATKAIIIRTVLDNTLEVKNLEDRGVPSWKPFQHSKGDVRTEEFYSYPLRINEYIPTRFL
ncbi:hypothetical protein Gotur_015161 [Gossypium turneri]